MQTPTILRRYLSTFIDGVVIIVAFIATSFLFTSDSSFASGTRIASLLGMFFLYEPVLTSRFCTVGQMVTGIRVRKVGTYERISIASAYVRLVVKVILGFFSLLTIPCTKGRRALHDFASGSMVICT